MDSITHLALGACMGEAFAGKKLGIKAMAWGALAQSIPDIDFLASFWMNPADNLLAHRGFTHSFLFVSMITPVFALMAERWHRPHDIRLSKWMIFFGAVILAHVLFDSLNNYGVGWWEPFSHKRVTFNLIYVADPFFSIWPAIAILLILVLKKDFNLNRQISLLGLSMSLIYLLYCGFNKYKIDTLLKRNIESQHLEVDHYLTTPAPLQNWLWYIVAGNSQGFYVGFHSTIEKNQVIKFEFFPKNDSLLANVVDHDQLSKLKRFSQGFYTVERWKDTLVFNDLRFGQMIGWERPKEKFVFHFYLDQPRDNELVVQRGRFKGWNRMVIKQFLHRIFYD